MLKQHRDNAIGDVRRAESEKQQLSAQCSALSDEIDRIRQSSERALAAELRKRESLEVANQNLVEEKNTLEARLAEMERELQREHSVSDELRREFRELRSPFTL